MEHTYPEETRWLQENYPNMTNSAKDIQILKWQDEWAIADYNPEFIDQLKILHTALESGFITKEEFEEEIKKIYPGYASKTVAVAFRKEKAVSFREFPSIGVIIHELGHIYFNVDDLEWNTVYGGGENLIHLTYKKKGNFTEKDIANYMELYRKLYFLPENKIDEFAWILGEEINKGLKKIGFEDLPIHPFSLMMFGGTIPSVEFKKGENVFWSTDVRQLDNKIKNKEIEFDPYSAKSSLLMFISVGMQDGLYTEDPFYKNYAKAFFENLSVIKEKINDL